MYCVSYLLYRLLQHEIKHLQITFYFKVKVTPIPTHCVPFSTRSYLCGTQSVCMDLWPPHLKNSTTVHTKQFKQFTQKYKMILVSHVHPGLLSPYSACKLDVLGLQSDSPCMNGQQSWCPPSGPPCNLPMLCGGP